MSEAGKRSRILFLILVVVAMAFWGGAWSVAKLVTGTITVQTVVFYRFFISALAILPVVFIFRQDFRLDTRGFLWILCGAALFTAYNELFFTGVKLGLAGAGGVLVTTTNPIFTYVLVVILFRHRLSLWAVVGLALGFFGGCVMLRIWTFEAEEIFRLGNGIFLISAVVWAGVTVVSGHAQKTVHFSTYTFYFYLFSAVLSLPFSLINGDTLLVFSQGAVFWLQLLYLSLFAMAFAASVFFIASNRLGSHRASHFVFLIPAFALLSSFLILGEVPRWYTVTGGLMALGAVYILNRPAVNGRPKKP